MNTAESKTLNSNSYDPDDGEPQGYNNGIQKWNWDIYSYSAGEYMGPRYRNVNSSFTFSPIALGLSPGRYEVELNVLDDDHEDEQYNYINGYNYYIATEGDWRGIRSFYVPGIHYFGNQYNEDVHYLPTGTGETFKYSLIPGPGSEWEPTILTFYIKDAANNYVYVHTSLGVLENEPDIPLGGDEAVITWDGLGNFGSYDDLPLPPGNYTVKLYVNKNGITAYETNPLTVFDVRIVTPCGDPTNPSDANEYNERVFNSNSPGVLTVLCTAIPTPDIPMGIWALFNFNDNKLRWTITSITGSTLTWDSSWPGASTKGEGTSCTATFTGLPSSNNSFGIKEVKLEFLPDGVNVTSTKTTNIEVFYTKTATNHPSDESNSDWPNWMYYWMQTVTPLGDPTPTFGYGTTNCYIWEWNEISLSDDCAMEANEPYATNNPLKGIDLFAWTVRHESQHYVDATAFWDHDIDDYLNNHLGFFGADDDYDGDYLPNQFEDENLNQAFNVGELYDWADDNTYETPGIFDDDEDWNCWRNKDVVGNHALYWAYPGMKHGQNDVYDN